jgi:delta 1-pyrroline-5-carboxylate dehydrogenase
VPPLDLVQLQCVGERVEHRVRRAHVPALLQALVVVGAEPGEHRDLLAAQAVDLAARAGFQPQVLGRGALPSRPQEVS